MQAGCGRVFAGLAPGVGGHGLRERPPSSLAFAMGPASPTPPGLKAEGTGLFRVFTPHPPLLLACLAETLGQRPPASGTLLGANGSG